MKNRNKLVLFDWNGVVDPVRGGNYYTYWEVIADAMRVALYFPVDMSDDKILKLLMAAGYGDLVLKCTTKESFVKALSRIFNKLPETFSTRTNTDAAKIFVTYVLKRLGNITYDKDILNFQLEIQQCCTVGLFTDIDWLNAYRIRNITFPINYDYTLLSHVLGVSKRNPKSFLHITDKLGYRPENIMLVDDSETNISLANDVGWHILHYNSKVYNIDFLHHKLNVFLHDN